MRRNGERRNLFLLCLLVLFSFFLASCTDDSAIDYLSDVLTMKRTAAGRTVVTITVGNGVCLDAFERAAEEKYNDIDLVLVGADSADPEGEIEKRLKSDDLTDLILFSTPDAGAQYQSERLIDLSSLSFSNSYTFSSLEPLRKNGKIYMVPLPNEITSIVYNKSYFAQNGYETPTDFESFLTLTEKITEDSAGKTRGFQAAFYDDMTLMGAYVMFGYDPVFQKRNGGESIVAYFNRADGASFSFTEAAYDNFCELFEKGIVRAEDFTLRSYQCAENLLNDTAAMTVGNASLVSALNAADDDDEWGTLPFYSGVTGSDWVMESVPGYYAMNKSLTKNRERYDAAFRVLEFMSTAEGQKYLMEDGVGNKSNLGTVVKSESSLWYGVDDLEETLRANHIAKNREFRATVRESVTIALRNEFRSAETGGDKSERFLRIVAEADEANLRDVGKQGNYLGAVSEDFTLAETGAFIADAMRLSAGADVALVLDNGKDGASSGLGISSKFYLGEIRERDLIRVMPILPSDDYGKLYKVTMTGAQLLSALEYALYNTGGGDGFYYFSGLIVKYDPYAEIGRRVRQANLENGAPINASYAYLVAISNGTVDPAYYAGETDIGITVYEAAADAIKRARTISPVKDGRFLILP